MEKLRSLFGKERQVTHATADDQVYPLHFIDRSASLRNTVHVSTWHFDDVLDGDTLHKSLNHLLQLGDWRKLGGRFRQGKDGKLEIHVPREFTSDRPAVRYSHESLPMRAMDHPLARKIPRATPRTSFHPATEEFLLPLTTRPGMPHNMNDYLTSDEPLLSLRVVVFHDATIVALAWPHAVMDLMGMTALVQAWTLVLAGRETEVLPLDGTHEDLLYQATLKPATEKYALEPYRLIGARLFMLLLRFFCDILFGGSRQTRIAYLPAKSVERLQSRALRQLNSNRDKPLQVSKSDVLLSLFSRSLILTQKRPLLVVAPLDLRSRLPDVFLPNNLYVQNAIQGGHFAVNADQTSGKSLGHLAQAFRQNLLKQGGRSQLLAMLRLNREISDSGGDPATLYGPSNALIMVATNLNRANLLSAVNFAPAVIGTRLGEMAELSPGTPCFFNTSHSKLAWRPGNILLNLCIDHNGGHWISGSFTSKTWKHIEESLNEI